MDKVNWELASTDKVVSFSSSALKSLQKISVGLQIHCILNCIVSFLKLSVEKMYMSFIYVGLSHS